ncbi:MAG TPA: hypothetical protein GX523_09725 [Desulfitobacterium dehalogenans]|uniref:Polysaccharide pyruvyl transferase domain-containing protein n=1 Tax=Desulfitobacterium dehalogenans TaxID=36854 RepID=A0A7C6Z4M7_9FIRM|nr:hypothetical protein [Desulfitobacterium dehalogenans]
MRNILFSTTRQWNCGDEFILFGVINLIKQVYPEGFNAIIYNRHPDLRTDIMPLGDLRDVKLYMPDELTTAVDANFRVGFRDNSLKRTLDGQFIDLVVFAGTPEWSNSRCFDLYEIIEKFNLPVIALGIGNRIQEGCNLIMRNLNRFKLFTVRAPELIEPLKEHISPPPVYLPCPSLCGADSDKIRNIDAVKHIGLIYSCDKIRSEINNCVLTETYEYLLALFRELICRYPNIKFSLVCHYVDELPFAISDFPEVEVLYSFDAKDYYEIYSGFDLVIGARVHGLGCAAAMGIPGIGIMHDFRGETVKGFLAETISINQSMETVFEIVEGTVTTISDKNRRLKEHITRTTESYLAIVSETLDFPKKSFQGYSPPLLHPTDNIFEGRPYLAEAMRELRGIPSPMVAERDSVIAERDRAIAERDRAIAERDRAIAERDSAIAERDSAIAERDRAIAERDSAIAERDSSIAERDSAIAERDRAIAERDSAIAERDSIINSTSWKFTAPLRAIMSLFRRIIGGKRK